MLRFALPAVAVVVAVACSPRSAPPPPDRSGDPGSAASTHDAPTTIELGPVDAAPWLVDPAPPDAQPAPPRANACPATYADASGACSYNELCIYAEGSCVCSAPPSCGGMAPPRDRPRTWQCMPKIRADGCPGRQPAEGSSCKPEGKLCDYTCSCVSTTTCKKGRWVVAHGPCKP